MTKRISRPALVALAATAGGLALLGPIIAARPAEAKQGFQGCTAENPPNPVQHWNCFFSTLGRTTVHFRAWKLDLNGAIIREQTVCGSAIPDPLGTERTVTQNGTGSFQVAHALINCIWLEVPSGGRIRAWVSD